MNDSHAVRRRSRFQSRIAAEREVLTIVNASRIGQKIQLAGMTRAAISEWEAQAQKVMNDGVAASVSNALLEIGRLAELLADDSRDVFRKDELVTEDDAVGRAKDRLRVLLQDN